MTNVILLVILWVFHILGPYLMSFHLLNGIQSKTFTQIFPIIMETVFKSPLIWSYLFLTWLVSITITEKLKTWRLRLEKDKRAKTVRFIRLAYISSRDKLVDLDNKVQFVSLFYFIFIDTYCH